MVEEITHYKAPIAVIPPQSLMKGEIDQLERKLRRLRSEDSIKTCQMQLDDAKRRLREYYATKG